MDRNATLNYTSTLEGSRSVLLLTCENDTSDSMIEQMVIVTCHSSGNWIPDPTQFTCSPFTTESSGTIQDIQYPLHIQPHNILVKINHNFPSACHAHS